MKPGTTRNTLRFCGLILLAGALSGGLSLAEDPAHPKREEDRPLYAGTEACARCHNPASVPLDPRHSGATKDGATGCEVCHGPGVDHIRANGDPSKILRFTAAGASARERCIGCHSNPHPDSPPAHRKADCLICHSIHRSKDEPLLREPHASLCSECHG